MIRVWDMIILTRWLNTTCTLIELNILGFLDHTLPMAVLAVPDLRHVDASCRLTL